MQTDVQTFTLYGRLPSAAFQQCCEAAAFVNATASDRIRVEVCYEVPRDYDDRKQQLQQQRKQQQQLQQQQTATVADDAAVAQSSDVLVVDAHGAVYSAAYFLALLQHATTYRALPRRSCELCTKEDNNNNDDNNNDNSSSDTSDAAAMVTASYAHAALHTWRSFLHARGNTYCWLSVAIDGRDVGCIVVELYSSVLPRTCNNFLHLCRGDGGTVCVPAVADAAGACNTPADDEAAAYDGDDDNNNTKDKNNDTVTLSYKGTTFFRTVRDAYVMAGDVSPGHGGNGGYSCYGRHFPDESYAVPHDAAGVVGMCNDGAHTNASSFYVTRRAMSCMNGRYVAFGRVIDGMRVVDAIHDVPVRHNQSPTQQIVITDCGELDVSM